MGSSEEHIISDEVVELTDTTLDDVVHGSDMPVLVHFWAPWCGACKLIAQIIREIAEEYSQKVIVGNLNTERERDSAVEFGISGLPTVILFKNGQVRGRWVGLTSKKDIRRAIEQLL
jgi:thioredoxin 1